MLLLPLMAGTAEEVRFNRDVRPILSGNCFVCHGPDKNNRKAGLRLDLRESALKDGAIVPGQPEKSEMVRRLFTHDPDDLMPPPDSNKKISPAERETLRRWIAQGARYEPHWSYLPPVRPAVPKVRDSRSGPSAIDAFIQSRLEEKHIKPSRETDRRTLLRRLSLDLTGLPPTPAEMDAFLRDPDRRAYERQVDRLLGSAHFGERMAVPWLDLVRFADTVGYHGDQNQNVFPYRDYVIRSFNQNKPFDQFTTEQLAGDLLPNPTVEQRVATGFNRLNMVTREGGAQPKEYLAKYAADRVRTVSTTWLGSTMGCCECHDHKFDPFSARDFYSMSAFFSDVKEWGVYSDYKYTPNPDLKGWDNDHPFPPEIEVESDYLKERARRLEARIGELFSVKADSARQKAFDQWREASGAVLKSRADGWVSPEVSVTSKTSNAVVAAENSVQFSGRDTKDSEHRISVATEPGWISSVRIEVLPGENGKVSRGRNGGSLVQLGAALVSTNDGKTAERKLSFYHAEADHQEPRYVNGAELPGVVAGWRISEKNGDAPQTSIWLLDPPAKIRPGETLVLTLKSNTLARVRFSISPLAWEHPLSSQAAELSAELQAAGTGCAAESSPLLFREFELSTAHDADIFIPYKKLRRELAECRDGRARTVVTEAWTPRVTRILPRGNWQDETGEIVDPRTPHFLPGPSADPAKKLTRLDLARWLVAPENPLTARTFVNRLWKQFFGAGLAATTDDLGLQGDTPSHPELLDWLAVEFRESGWDIKHMVRLLVTSAAYRRDSSVRMDLRELDPNNRLLAAQNPRRLEAEFVRDNALFIAGLLNLDLGGPSAHPYQPAGYYSNLQFPDRDYTADRDEREYRRGLYTHWQRTFLHPMLANFDAPSREECTANRTVSNTPQQALTLLNDPTFVEAAHVFATRLLAGAGKDSARIDSAFIHALGRPARARERSSLVAFLQEQRAYYQANEREARKLIVVGVSAVPKESNPIELAAWTSVCRVIFNLHETITVY